MMQRRVPIEVRRRHRQTGGNDRRICNSLQTRIERPGSMPINRLDAAALPRDMVGIPEIDDHEDDGWDLEPCNRANCEHDQNWDHEIRDPASSMILGGIIKEIE